MNLAKISSTASPVAYIRYYHLKDKESEKFIDLKTKLIFSLLKFLSKKTYDNILLKRAELSSEIETYLRNNKPEQIVELASGFSTYGIRLTKNNPDLVYIEIDTDRMIEKKKDNILNKTKNHILLGMDLSQEDILEKIKPYLKKDKKTLIFSEGLNPYLTNQQHNNLIKKIKKIMNYISNSVYLSHDLISSGRIKMFKGKIGFLLGKLHTLYTGSKADKHFKDKEEIKKYFKSEGLKRCKILKESAFLLYEVKK